MRRNRKVLSTHQKKRQKTETVKEVDQMLIYQRFQSSHYKYVQRNKGNHGYDRRSRDDVTMSNQIEDISKENLQKERSKWKFCIEKYNNKMETHQRDSTVDVTGRRKIHRILKIE